MFDRLKNLKVHSAFFLLKNCFAVPKLNYLIRSSPFCLNESVIKRYDDKLKETLQGILNLSLLNNSWTQATLPIANGGFGIRKLHDISLPAFLSSSYGTIGLVSQILNSSDESIISYMHEALDAWLSVNPSNPSFLHNQSSWDKINIDRIVNDELHFSHPTDIARFLALQRPESNAWLNAIPSRHIGTFLDDHHIRICLALRVGAEICRPHICTCGTFVSEYGLHGLSCQRSAGRLPRHIELNTILCQSLSAIHKNSTLEPPGLFRDDGKKPDGLTLVPWARGRYLVWDATCWDTLAPSHLNVSRKQAGRVAELASNAKHEKYVELKRGNYIFNAFAVETLGPWSSDALHLISKIGPKLNEVSGDFRSHEYLVQRISLAIQRANASSILSTIPASTRLDQIFYL